MSLNPVKRWLMSAIGRSATVVAAYLMKTLNIPPEEAVEMIREKRPVV